ncbi:aconitase X [Komagataeibacter sp. FNDCF1]|uniref:cis-3-hydroxy-L-proline dehydratase n=1 Tax=Komagataeibacter sp. FNDCF1 TaxID=2878681 RepID=UPI001E310279|nr:aconitase X [Komagataeibacter sp. FNDCF1]MCE2563320.1 aconitase X [Komagataeibacter sp. FNDCF1]
MAASRDRTTAAPQATCRVLVEGSARGPLLHADTGLSFWGGINPATGEVIDRHHPLSGACVTDAILAIPNGRGSCTGSSVMLELLLNGKAPAGLVLAEPDEILVLGVVVTSLMFGRSIPVLCVGAAEFHALGQMTDACIADGALLVTSPAGATRRLPAGQMHHATDAPSALPALSAHDRDMLDGRFGPAAAGAMKIVLAMATLQGAERLIDISQAHIDGCIYTGPASLRFARQLVAWGARVRVRVPTTLNAISVDQRRWRSFGIAPSFGEPAVALAEAYEQMGAKGSFTCAPYLLDSAPGPGEQIVWAESNAVVFANSVLGARTLKYPDYLDICVALTGRAPFVGSHRAEGRHACVHIDVDVPADIDDSFFPVLGYLVGLLSGTEIPAITGLACLSPDHDALKAFSAAFATTSAAPMFHAVGVTPEAPTLQAALGHRAARRQCTAGITDLRRAWMELDSATQTAVQLVSIGNPHASLGELRRLAALCRDGTRADGTAMIVTTGRDVYAQAHEKGYIQTIEAFGATMVTDTCWCMIGEPLVPPQAHTLMTNSGKYAHYAPGLVGRHVRFGSLAACVQAARTAHAAKTLPRWLAQV